MILHKNIMAVIKSINKISPPFVYENDQSVPFLPLSHVFERVAGHFYGMYAGITSSYAQSIETFAVDIREKKPTVVLAVPRACEKVYQKITMQVAEQPQWKQKIFLSALVNINLNQAKTLAKKNNIDFDKPQELLKNKEFLSIVDEHVAERNSHLARYETIKKYKIIENEFSQETGELTASLKLKRNVIYEKYKSLIQQIYDSL